MGKFVDYLNDTEMKSRITLLFLVLYHVNIFAQEKPHVLLISFDGFRHDYVEKYDAKNFKKFISEGASAESLIPSFPSKTFPNHYSIVTGLYPGHHGLVANTFLDPYRNQLYKISNRERVEDAFYYGGTPLWQLTQENGYKSASYFWVGSEANIKGQFPDYYYKYDGSVQNKDRIDKVVEWLKLPEKDRPRFISLYFSLVDDFGHKFGPNSVELKQNVLEADKLLGYLQEELADINLPLNIILVSDHGMIEVNTKNEIDFNAIEKVIPNPAEIVYDKILSMVFLPESEIDATYQIIKKLEHNFQVFKKGEMPDKWHYNEHYRIGDLILMPKPGYAFRKTSISEKITGEHGYDPYTTPEMHGILYAQGPNITKGLRSKSIENVNIYPLITEILGFKKSIIDGHFENIKAFYKK
jgi:ectonucleotide pyrophosphatase/phosphodiesterase family member 4